MDTKALRQKVLDLAIRGKLVPQDPDDEPASVLLEHIRTQKQQMVREGKLKPKDIKDDTIIFVGEDNLHYEKFADGTIKCIENEIPFEIPDGWEWSRFSSFSFMMNGTSKRSGKDGQPTIVLRLADLGEDNILFSDCRTVTLSEDEILKYGLKHDDILFVRVNGSKLNVGKSYLFSEKNTQVAFCDHIIRARVLPLVLPELLCSYMRSGYVRQIIASRIVSAAGQNTISQPSLSTILIPIAPYKEQVRQIEAIRDANSSIRIIENNQADLLSLIDFTKAKIFDLAIRGQLVSQNPDDEPASVLLERIRAEKEKLIKQGKIKRDKRESVIFRGEDNSYYLRTGDLVEPLADWKFDDLPDSWAICCLGEVCDYGNCINVETSVIDDSEWILDLEDIEKDTGRILTRVKKADRASASTKHQFHKGQVLYSKLRPYLNKVVLADQDGYCTSEILPLEFLNVIIPEYARYYLMSPTFLQYANHCSYGVKMPRLGTEDGKKAILPIPPLREQEQIVRKIQQVFSLFDCITTGLQ